MQYLAPIIKNRQYNFPPLGVNPFVGASARPNEITYSENRLNPNLRPAARRARATGSRRDCPQKRPLRRCRTPTPTDPSQGLQG